MSVCFIVAPRRICIHELSKICCIKLKVDYKTIHSATFVVKTLDEESV